jgi:gamma-glutamyltranspeptidase / glutathione hydrolase
MVGLFVVCLISVAAAPFPERGVAMVATDHELASSAGAEILALGGNAVDAAVAAALAAGVVQPAGSGLGGGGFALVMPAGAEAALVFDFREVAPMSAHRDMYLDDEGQADTDRSQVGALAVAVPGQGRGLAALMSEYGSFSLKTVAAPAIRYASRGFEVGPSLGLALASTRHDEVRSMFLLRGKVAIGGDQMRQVHLADTLRKWAATNGEYLYTGAGAREIVAEVNDGGGSFASDDFKAYTPKKRAPIVVQYRDYTLYTMSPPSSGGVALGQMLRVLEKYDLESLGHNSSDYVHLLAEVMKHAYADRAHHLGDPDFYDVQVERLLSDERIGAVQRSVWPGRTFAPDYYGPLIASPRDGGTQHISVVDNEGGAVALTTTINTSFGSGVVVEALGIILNNEMDDFSAKPGVPNFYGLLGSEANSIEPEKRPLSSMTPTIVLDERGEVVMSIGASGGSHIISSVLQVFLNVVEFGMDPQAAVSRPRLHHQWQPDHLVLDEEFSRDVIKALEMRGHTIEMTSRKSSVQLVVRRSDRLEGGSDPRKAGWPAGIP